MISNPISFFVNGSETRSFTYEGGKNLYHFSPNFSGLSETMEMNLIFFADDINHAKEVLERMMLFALKCFNIDYVPDHPELAGKRTYDQEKFIGLLDNKDKWVIIPIETNQFFKVGWASNDTI